MRCNDCGIRMELIDHFMIVKKPLLRETHIREEADGIQLEFECRQCGFATFIRTEFGECKQWLK